MRRDRGRGHRGWRDRPGQPRRQPDRPARPVRRGRARGGLSSSCAGPEPTDGRSARPGGVSLRRAGRRGGDGGARTGRRTAGGDRGGEGGGRCDRGRSHRGESPRGAHLRQLHRTRPAGAAVHLSGRLGGAHDARAHARRTPLPGPGADGRRRGGRGVRQDRPVHRLGVPGRAGPRQARSHFPGP